MGRGIALILLLLSAALSGCGDRSTVATPSAPAASPTAALPADGRVRVATTVLDDGDGPELCLGGVADSLPPQCGGPPISGWNWEDHPDADSAGGVRWGDFVLVGDWDGSAFTSTEARPWTEADLPAPEEYDFSTPCPEPEGGWRVVDDAMASPGDMTRAMRVAEELSDYALAWVDQSINPSWEEWESSDATPSREVEEALNDPAYSVLNVGVTDDLAGAEAAVSEVWGGALCVHHAANSFTRLEEVTEELRELPGSLDAQFGTVDNRVHLTVIHDDGSIQAWVEEEYGAGMVEVSSALQPVD